MKIMIKNKLLHGTTFFGNEASDYAKKTGRLDYATLAKSFNAILNNNIIPTTSAMGYEWDIENGSLEYFEDNNGNIYTYDEKEDRIDELEKKLEELEELDSEDTETEIEEIKEDIEALESEYYNDISQYYIISAAGADILKEWTNEIVFYNKELNMYVWGINHGGTIWSYVLTDIKLEQ